MFDIYTMKDYQRFAEEYIQNMSRKQCIRFLHSLRWYTHIQRYEGDSRFKLQTIVWHVANDNGFSWFCKARGIV